MRYIVAIARTNGLDRPEIGIHGSAEMLCEFSYASGMTVIHVDDIDTMGTTPSVSARAR